MKNQSKIRYRTFQLRSIPCRHAVLCVDCMHEIRTNHDGRCPICRTKIDAVLVGSFDAEFVDLVAMAAARAAPAVARARDYTFLQMYDNVRCFLLLGVLLCGLAAASLATGSGWAPWLFALCILLGWLPWFLVTVYSLEKEDSERPTVFQPDDSCCALS